MKRIILAAASLFLSIGSFAQDMIVKKDGTIIQAKVSEIGTVEVKYKKWSNLDGPSYAITKNDILAITYQNGEKETFESEKPVQLNETKQKASLNEYVSSEKNMEAINTINNAPFSIDNPDASKRAENVGLQFGVSTNSVVNTDVLSVYFDICRETYGGECHSQPVGLDKANINYKLRTQTKKIKYFTVLGHPVLVMSIANNSDKLMYVDLANTFLTLGDKSESYYVPTATTTTTSSSSGASFNLGGITNGLGIGGVAGSLANATTVGGSHGTSVGSTVFSQRIVSIPPHSRISLPYKAIEDNRFLRVYNNAMKFGQPATEVVLSNPLTIGEELVFDENNSPFHATFFTTVSYDENMSSPMTSTTSVYCKKVLGMEDKTNNWYVYIKYLNYSENGRYTFGYVRKK